MGGCDDARRLTPEQQEVVRLRVVAALESGTVGSYRQAAAVFGVSERSVGSWWRAYRTGGREALSVHRTYRPGPAELISDEQRETLCAAMVDYAPEDLLVGGPLWTRTAVAELIRMVIGVTMTERGVGKWLARHGFTPQRGTRRTYQQQDAQVQTWLQQDYPAIVARARTEHAALAWIDQCGLHSETAPPGRTWAPRGCTPVVAGTGQRLRINVLSAIASRGALWFTVFSGSFTAEVLITFLDRLARQAGRKVYVIADRHPVHRSTAVRTWLKTNTDRLELHLLPGYSPELNPDEILNADLKRHVHASRARSTDDLASQTRRFLHRRQHQPHIVARYFHAPHVRYTIM